MMALRRPYQSNEMSDSCNRLCLEYITYNAVFMRAVSTVSWAHTVENPDLF